EVAFKASAAIPRIYRMRFHRDIYKDLRDLEKGIDKNDPENSNLDLFSLEMFENIAYVMAKHADPSIPDTPEEWLDGFNTFSDLRSLLRPPPLYPGSTGCGSTGIFIRTCGIWKRGLTRMTRRIPTWTCFPWKCLRTSPM